MGSDTERFLLSLNGLLPLHRAISGFHFHGVQHLLLSTLQVLVESGADIAKQDHGEQHRASQGTASLHFCGGCCFDRRILAALWCAGKRPKSCRKRGVTARCTSGRAAWAGADRAFMRERRGRQRSKCSRRHFSGARAQSRAAGSARPSRSSFFAWG